MNRKLIKAILCTICLMIPLAACGNMGNLPKGEFLQSYDSPNSEFTINIYLCNGGATTDFSIRGEVVDNRNSNIKIFIGAIMRQQLKFAGSMKKPLLLMATR